MAQIRRLESENTELKNAARGLDIAAIEKFRASEEYAKNSRPKLRRRFKVPISWLRTISSLIRMGTLMDLSKPIWKRRVGRLQRRKRRKLSMWTPSKPSNLKLGLIYVMFFVVFGQCLCNFNSMDDFSDVSVAWPIRFGYDIVFHHYFYLSPLSLNWCLFN